jgi:cyanophycinase
VIAASFYFPEIYSIFEIINPKNMRMFLNFLFSLIAAIVIIGCSKHPEKIGPKGKLYIIGGGEHPKEMIKQLVDLSGVKAGEYIVILPMASSIPDSSAIDQIKEFKENGVTNITYFNFKKGDNIPQTRLDSIINSGMIYITGGDQSVFMDVVLNTPIYKAIHEAYSNGTVIAGTSAGAAVMSKKMITGNQLRYPKAERFGSIVSNNIEVREGLGMLDMAIIDQHFVKRARLNRLVSVCIENPKELCVGIDESTAILVQGDSAKVYGASQVIVLSALTAQLTSADTLLKAKNIALNIYSKGDSFLLKKE